MRYATVGFFGDCAVCHGHVNLGQKPFYNQCLGSGSLCLGLKSK